MLLQQSSSRRPAGPAAAEAGALWPGPDAGIGRRSWSQRDLALAWPGLMLYKDLALPWPGLQYSKSQAREKVRE